MATLITNEQMKVCNNLFDLGFRFRTLYDNGQIVLTKRTNGGLAVLTLSTNGFINEKDSSEFFNYYLANPNQMASPNPITIKPSGI